MEDLVCVGRSLHPELITVKEIRLVLWFSRMIGNQNGIIHSQESAMVTIWYTCLTTPRLDTTKPRLLCRNKCSTCGLPSRNTGELVPHRFRSRVVASSTICQQESHARWSQNDGRDSQISTHYRRGRQLHGDRRGVDNQVQLLTDLHGHSWWNERAQRWFHSGIEI